MFQGPESIEARNQVDFPINAESIDFMILTHAHIDHSGLIPKLCKAGFMGNGGEIFVFDMGKPVKIYDLAVKMITLAGLKPGEDIPITFSGLRPGEKLYEELLANEENTLPTYHPKIKRAKVRRHQFEVVTQAVDALQKATKTESNLELVCRMRALVPEFVPQNPEYCQENAVLKRG